MPDDLELIMYSRTTGCPYISIARRALQKVGIPYRELMIDENKLYEQRVLDWTGFLSVPTMVIARRGEDLPYSDPSLLPKGASPRGIDRGAMITEASEDELIAWLKKHGMLP